MIEVGKEYIVDLSGIKNPDNYMYAEEKKYFGKTVRVQQLLSPALAGVVVDGLNVFMYTRCLKPLTKTEEFILPKKWYTAVTPESIHDINIFRAIKGLDDLTLSDVNYYPYIHYDGFEFNKNRIQSFNTGFYADEVEITYEQFKKYVLKTDIKLDDKPVIIQEINPAQGYSLSQIKNGILSIEWMEKEDATDIFEGIKNYLQTIKIDKEELQL